MPDVNASETTPPGRPVPAKPPAPRRGAFPSPASDIDNARPFIPGSEPATPLAPAPPKPPAGAGRKKPDGA